MDWQAEWDSVLQRHRQLNARREEAMVQARSAVVQRTAAPPPRDEPTAPSAGVKAAAVDLSALGKAEGGGDDEDVAIDKAFVTTVRSMMDELVQQAHVAKRELRERRRCASGEAVAAYSTPSGSRRRLRSTVDSCGEGAADQPLQHDADERSRRRLARPASAGAISMQQRSAGVPAWLKPAARERARYAMPRRGPPHPTLTVRLTY
jgi:hypothetical protein